MHAIHAAKTVVLALDLNHAHNARTALSSIMVLVSLHVPTVLMDPMEYALLAQRLVQLVLVPSKPNVIPV